MINESCVECADLREPGWEGIDCCGLWFCCEECWATHDQIDGHDHG